MFSLNLTGVFILSQSVKGSKYCINILYTILENNSKQLNNLFGWKVILET